MKKEYVTYWTIEKINPCSEKIPWNREKFFNRVPKIPDEIIVPDDIGYFDLLGFLGRKTKVTIEVID